MLGNRDIKALGVKCNNHLNGCHWLGTIGTLDQHLDKCDYAIVKCPNKCRGSNLLRKDLQHHRLSDAQRESASVVIVP